VTPRAWAALLAVGGIWGASFLFIRVALEEVSPGQVVLFRTCGGAVVLLALVRTTRPSFWLTPRLAAALALLAAVSTLAPLLLISWAETRIDSGTAAVLNAAMPIFTLLFAAALFEDERLSARAAAGALLGIGGVALLSGGTSGFGDSSLLGDMAVVLATACYAAGNVMVRSLVQALPGLVISAAQIAVAAAVMASFSAAASPPRFDLSWDVWGSLIALGLAGTGFAYVGYYWLIERAGSFRASLVTYVIPVVGVALGAIVLDESVGVATVAGGVLIGLGVALATGALDAALGGAVLRRPSPAAKRPRTP